MISKLIVKNEIKALKKEIKILKKASSLNLLNRAKEIIDFMNNSPILKILFEPYIVENDKKIIEFLESNAYTREIYNETYQRVTNEYISKIDESIKFALSLLNEFVHRDESLYFEKLKNYDDPNEEFTKSNAIFEIINTAFERIEYKLDILISELNEIKENEINEKQITIINNGINNGIIMAGNGNLNSIDSQFDNIRKNIETNIVDRNKKEEIINILNDIKDCVKSKNSNNFYALYTKFVSKIADYVTIVPPILGILKMFMP